MTVIEMPVISATRSDATSAVGVVGPELAGANVIVHFPPDAIGTPSVLSELLRTLLLEHGASSITFVNTSDYIREALSEMAESACLAQRINFATHMDAA